MKLMFPAFQRLSFRLFVAAVLFSFAYGVGSAQEADDLQALQQRFDAELEKGRELAKVCREISARFYDSSLAGSHKWKEKWPEAAGALAEQRVILEQAGLNLFFALKKPDEPILQLAGTIAQAKYEAGDCELAHRILLKLENFVPNKDVLLDRQLALTGLKCNRFERALQLMQTRAGIESIEKLEKQLDKNMFFLAPALAKSWETESSIRKQEQEADDLPRVKLELSTGEVILELFENEAPETVANFIHRVESGIYDDSWMAPVVDQIVAQGGLGSRENGPFQMKYLIQNESRKQDARKHFVGSVSMVSRDTDTTASLFFAITRVPNPDLDWNGEEEDEVSQTVFGRVVSGMENVAALPATLEIDEETKKEKPVKGVEPGFIIRASVIRKRDHDYSFRKIELPAKDRTTKAE